MAGIGFSLQRLLKPDSYLSTTKAYLYAALISSGPWLITILVIGVLGFLQAGDLGALASQVFRATIVYIYCFSLIGVGILQMPLTRHLADLLFTRDIEMYLPTYVAALALVGVAQILFAAPIVLLCSEWTFFYAFQALSLYLVVSFIWIAMIFLSAAKDFTSISVAFIAGGAVSIAGALVLGRSRGIEGYLAGYTAGQFLLFLLLTLRMVHEFPSRLPPSFDFLRTCRAYPLLMLIGLLYNAAIWVDKFLFWYGPPGERIDAMLRGCGVYDAPMYLAYLTIVPSLALFLIRIETSFYRFYKDYYGAITGKKSLRVIREMREAMTASIRLSIGRLLKLQGTISLVAVLAVPYLIEPLGLSWLNLCVLRIGIIGAFLHVLLLLLTVMLLYFEFQRETLALVALFFVSNIVFTWLTLGMNLAWYGYGYFAACFVSLAAGVVILDFKLRDLDYITFMKQPV